MTKIGEEGISFYNDIFAIHAIGQIDSTVAEQLGNRPRKHPTQLFIHIKKKMDKHCFFNKEYSEIKKGYKQRMKLVQADVLSKVLMYKHRAFESFRQFTLWDDYTNEISFSPLKVVADLYEIDRKNEFNSYDYYFKNKMEHYGWVVNFEEDKSEDEVRIEFSKKSHNEQVSDIKTNVHYFKKFMYGDASAIIKEKDFVDYMKRIDKDIDETLVKNVFNDYGFLSLIYDDETIYEALETNNRTDKTFKRLFLLNARERDGDDRMTQWLYKNVVTGKEYLNTEIQALADSYIKEQSKYEPTKPKPLTVQAMNRILSDCFKMEKVTKKVNAKTQQVVKIIPSTINHLRMYSF